MMHLIDKLVLLICCCSLLVQQISEPSMAVTICLLVCLAASAVFEFAPGRMKLASFLVICIATLFIQGGASLLPLAAYDATRVFLDVRKRDDIEHSITAWFVHSPWVVSLFLAVGLRGVGIASFALTAALCLTACLFSWKTSFLLSQDVDLHSLRDTLQEKIDLLSRKNTELVEAQDQAAKVAVLTERSRISREIHDSVGHLLTRSILQIEALRAIHADDSEIATELSETASTLREALETTRSSVHAMADEAFDLAIELNRLAEEGSVPSVSVDYDVEDDVPTSVARCFFAVARESLTNASRHGRASQASIHVTGFPAFWQLVVSNNGAVPDLRTGGNRVFAMMLSESGMGIRSMQERVEALGGTFHISCEHGFKVFASIPKKGVR